MSRQIEVSSDEPYLLFEIESVSKCLAVLDSSSLYDIPMGSLGINFVNMDTSGQLHAQFFNDPDPTDVMTFPGDSEDGHAGDIAICPWIAAEQCRPEGTTFAEELTLYLVHACLHLAGLDDKDPESVAEMRKGEALMMQLLQDNSALLVADWLRA